MGRVGPNDSIIIYFAGHRRYADVSDQEGKTEKYFVPVDFVDEGDPYNSAIPMQEIVDYFGRVRATSIVMIFDACQAGAARLDDQVSELSRFALMAGKYRTNAIIAAARATQKSYEFGSHGLFTQYLTLGLRGQADEDGDGIVTLTEIAKYVERTVPVESRQKAPDVQEPVWLTNDRTRASSLGVTSFGKSNPADRVPGRQ
ncbi:MAG: hypothetical protein ABSA52_11780 [Candidatus Binatia bacterium]